MSCNKSWDWHGKSERHEWKHEDSWHEKKSWGHDGGHGWKHENECSDWGSKSECRW